MPSPSEKSAILIIDDQPAFPEDLIAMAGDEFQVIIAATGEEGLSKFRESPADLILLDLKLGRGMDGLETLRQLKKIDPDAAVIIITAHASHETALEAGRLGVLDYQSKALNLKALRPVIQQHLQNQLLRRAYREELQHQYPRFVGESAVVRQLFNDIAAVAPTDSVVLITGESGTGKELVAREIHRQSLRASRAMLTINCSNLSPELCDNEFFGHGRGAFTGADRMQKGKFEEAGGSTLFLDEVGDLPLASQPKILRALEYGTFTRLGETQERRTDVRLVAATNKNLPLEVTARRFRDDLLRRLDHIHLHLPPLRERRDDISLLVQYYLHYFSVKMHKPVPEVSEDFLAGWRRYDWPGNVRELGSFIEKAVIYSREGRIEYARLPSLASGAVASPQNYAPLFDLPYERAKETLLEEFQREYFREVVTRCGGNLTRAAEVAGVNRSTIYRSLGREERVGDGESG